MATGLYVPCVDRHHPCMYRSALSCVICLPQLDKAGVVGLPLPYYWSLSVALVTSQCWFTMLVNCVRWLLHLQHSAAHLSTDKPPPPRCLTYSEDAHDHNTPLQECVALSAPTALNCTYCTQLHAATTAPATCCSALVSPHATKAVHALFCWLYSFGPQTSKQA